MSNNSNRSTNSKKPLNRGPRFGSGFAFYAILIAGLLFFSTFVYGKSSGTKVEASLSQVYDVIENPYCTVKKVEVEGTTLTMEYLNAQNKTSYITQNVPSIYVDNLIDRLDDYKAAGKLADYDYVEPVNWDVIFSVLSTVVLGVIIIFFFLSLTRQTKDSNSVFSFGNSRAKLTAPNEMKVKFADVAGSKEEKEELSEIVDFLKNPKKYQELGAKIPKGALLYGAPGTGKTLLARAVAGEAGVPFFYISGSDFVEMLVGVGASRVRSLFADAKKAAPAVIFIDEIDAVGRKRGAGLGGGQDEREQTLNQILVEMDGFDVNTNVIVMAATNRVDVLDPALLRPGRFDRRIMVNPPDADEREAILKIHAKNKPLDKDVSLREVALSTVGFTGADLQNLLNEAALLSARRNKKKISSLEISDSMFRVMMGPEKNSRKLSDRVKKLTAYHESGHAIVLRATSDFEKVDRVTIIPAGQAGGFTAYKPKEDLDYYTEKMLLDSIKMSLGGRAAEEIFLGEISTGAASDLQHCNRIATNMIKRYGLSPKFKNMVFGDENEEVFVGGSFGQVQSYSDATAAEIDKEVQRIINECYEETKRILIEKKDIVEGLSNRLIEVLKVDSPEFEAIYDANGDLEVAARILEEQRKADEQKHVNEAEVTSNENDNSLNHNSDSVPDSKVEDKAQEKKEESVSDTESTNNQD